MAAQRRGTGWMGPFRIRVAFAVPLRYAFEWCTDYTPEDAALEDETYERKVIERSARRVVFEDLEDTKSGWIWGRDIVILRPPNRWHMDGVGNRRDVTADYVLTRLPDGTTQLDLRWSRKPNVHEAKTLTKAEREASALLAWKRFGTAMERDYRAGRPARSRKT